MYRVLLYQEQENLMVSSWLFFRQEEDNSLVCKEDACGTLVDNEYLNHFSILKHLLSWSWSEWSTKKYECQNQRNMVLIRMYLWKWTLESFWLFSVLPDLCWMIDKIFILMSAWRIIHSDVPLHLLLMEKMLTLSEYNIVHTLY